MAWWDDPRQIKPQKKDIVNPADYKWYEAPAYGQDFGDFTDYSFQTPAPPKPAPRAVPFMASADVAAHYAAPVVAHHTTPYVDPADYKWVEPIKYDWRDPNQEDFVQEVFDVFPIKEPPSPRTSPYPQQNEAAAFVQPKKEPWREIITGPAEKPRIGHPAQKSGWDAPPPTQREMDAQWILRHQSDYSPQAVWNAMQTLGLPAGERPPEVMPTPSDVYFDPQSYGLQTVQPSPGLSMPTPSIAAMRAAQEEDAYARAISNPTVQRWIKFLIGN